MGTVIKAVVDGQEREFEILRNWTFGPWTHAINFEGEIVPSNKTAVGGADARIFLRLIQMRHTFGGVVFEETGEFRKPLTGEWSLISEGPWFWQTQSIINRTILHPLT